MSRRVSPESFGGFRGLVGVAREDITPPVGIYARNWGAAAHDAAEGIHRPLTVTALALFSRGVEEWGSPRVEEKPLLLCSLDLGWWRTAEDEWALRGSLLDALD